MKKHFNIFVVIILAIVISVTGCSKSNTSSIVGNTNPADYPQISFKEVPAALKVVPDDLSNPSKNRFHLVETTNGVQAKLFASFTILNPQYSTPIYQKTATSYLLLYAPTNTGVYALYHLGSKKIVDSHNDGTLYKTDANEYIPNNILKTPDDFGPVSLISVNYNPSSNSGTLVRSILDNSKKPTSIYIFKTEQALGGEGLFVSLNGLDTKGIVSTTASGSEVKEQYTKLTASYNAKNFYYDNIDSSMKPNIYKYGEYPATSQLFVANARHPVATDDDTILAYSYSAKATFNDQVTWATVITQNGKQVKTYDDEKIVLMNEQNKTIDVLDPVRNTVEVLDMKTIQIVGEGTMDKGFVFPQIYNGELQYTCPAYTNGKVSDYIVKQEG